MCRNAAIACRGQIMWAAALLAKPPSATDEEINEAMNANHFAPAARMSAFPEAIHRGSVA
jgi:aerobic-type carbon monoxide dehydrogenase small subunit (CoxS/CutS family)